MNWGGTMNTFKSCSAATVLAMISACGGGGGSSAPNLSSAPGESAISAYVQANHQSSLNATDGVGNTYNLQISSVPNSGTTTFNGQTANSTVDTGNFSHNGLLQSNDITTEYYTLNPYTPLGSVSNTGTPYEIVTSFSALPATVTVGATGAFASSIFYHDSTQAVIDANSTETFSVKANNSKTLLVCLNFVISNVTAQGTADGLVNSTESDCYTVDAAGNANLSTIAVTVNGTTLNFH
jgi:hypothetical protein